MNRHSRRQVLASGLALAASSLAGCLTDGSDDDGAGTGDGTPPGPTVDGVPDPVARIAAWLPVSTATFGTWFYASPANADYEAGAPLEAYADEDEIANLQALFGVEPGAVRSATVLLRAGEETEEHVVLGSFDVDAVVDRLASSDTDPDLEPTGTSGGFERLEGAADRDFAVGESAVVASPDVDGLLAVRDGEGERLLTPEADATALLESVTIRDYLRWRHLLEDERIASSAREQYDDLGVRQRLETGAADVWRRHAVLFDAEPDDDAVSSTRARVGSFIDVDEVVETEVGGRVVVFDVEQDTSPDPPVITVDTDQRADEPRTGYVTISFEVTAIGGGSTSGSIRVEPAPDEAGTGYDGGVVVDLRVGALFEVAYERGETVETGDRVQVVWSPEDGGDERVIAEHVVV